MKNYNSEIQELKKLVKSEKQDRPYVRYSPKLKAVAVDLIRKGLPIPAIASVTDLNKESLRAWSSRDSSYNKPTAFRQLSINRPSEDAVVELIFPNGLRLRGLSLKQALEVVGHATAA